MRFFARVLFCALVCLLLPGLALGSESQRIRHLTLAQCIRIALSSNTDLAKGRLDRKMSKYDRRIGDDYFWPDLYIRPESDYETDDEGRLRLMAETEVIQQIPTGGELTLRWRNDWNRYTKVDDEDWTSRFTVSLKQPLLRGAGLTVGMAPMVLPRYEDEQERWQFTWLVVQRLTSVQRAYWDLALAWRRLDITRQAMNDLDRLHRDRRAEASESELLAIESEQAAFAQDYETRLWQAAKANLTLVDLLDEPGLETIQPIGRLEIKPVSPQLEACLVQALKNRPDLKQYDKRVDEAKLRYAVAESNALTDVDLVVTAASEGRERRTLDQAWHEAFRLHDEWVFGLGAELRFGVPARDRTEVYYRYQLRKAELDLDERRQTVRNEVTSDVMSLKRSLKAVSLAQRSSKLAVKKYELAAERLKRGLIDNLKVILYQRDANNALNSEYQAIVDYLKDLADLDRSMGVTLETWHVTIKP